MIAHVGSIVTRAARSLKYEEAAFNQPSSSDIVVDARYARDADPRGTTADCEFRDVFVHGTNYGLLMEGVIAAHRPRGQLDAMARLIRPTPHNAFTCIGQEWDRSEVTQLFVWTQPG